MRSYLRGEEGISLIMTLIMLVVVLILVSAFMRASIFNINFSQEQLDQKRAFYAAEAGVQHLQSLGGEYAYNDREDLYLHDELYKDIEGLFVEYRVDYNEEVGSFESIGTADSGYGEFEQRILFNFKLGGPKDLATLLYAYGAENLYQALEDNNDIEPGTDDDIWDPIEDFPQENLEDLGINVSEIEIWHEDREYVEGDYVVNTLDARGNPKQYSVDNIDLFDFLDVKDDHEFEDEVWSEFFHNFVELYSMEHEEDEDKDLHNWRNDEEDTYFYGDHYYGFDIKDSGTIDKDVERLHEIYSPLAEIGEEIEEWDSEIEYEKGDKVEHEGYYYEAQVEEDEVTTEEPGDSDEWERIDSEDRFAGVEINDSVIIVDGDLEMSNVTLNSSLLIVKGQIDFRGTQTFNDSLLIGFNEGTEDDAHAISGTPSVKIDEILTRSTFEDWPIIREIIDELIDEEDFVHTDELKDWRVN